MDIGHRRRVSFSGSRIDLQAGRRYNGTVSGISRIRQQQAEDRLFPQAQGFGGIGTLRSAGSPADAGRRLEMSERRKWMKTFDKNYKLLEEMYQDGYFPDFLVDKVKAELQKVIDLRGRR